MGLRLHEAESSEESRMCCWDIVPERVAFPPVPGDCPGVRGQQQASWVQSIVVGEDQSNAEAGA